MFPLVIVTNEQLVISIITGCVISIVALGGIVFNLYNLFKANYQRNKFIRLFFIVFFIVVLYFSITETAKNYFFYNNYIEVEGKIIDFCRTEKNEEGVLFEYEVMGKTYHNCNVYFPVPKDSIDRQKIYIVRVNKLHPADGRILLK